MTNDSVLEVRDEDGIRIMMLNRPDSLNAINAALSDAIAVALRELDEDDRLAVGVLGGYGRAFSAGMDIKAFVEGNPPTSTERGFAGLVEQPPAKPLIAAIDGLAFGGGFEIALACDIIVASENASFSLPEVKRGLGAAAGGLLRLAQRVPYFRAMEWVLTGAAISVAEAQAAGLISSIVPAGQSLTEAVALAKRIAANGPLAVRASKAVVANLTTLPIREGFAAQDALLEPLARSFDAAEGTLAFVERRPPQWRGR